MFLCSVPSRLCYGPSLLWRTKGWPAKGLRACFGGKEVLCFAYCIVVSWGVGGKCGVRSPVELSACGMSWFWLRQRGQSIIPTLKLGTLQHIFPRNRTAIGNGSICVSLAFSGSSKIYEGPHPLLSVHCVPWSGDMCHH